MKTAALLLSLLAAAETVGAQAAGGAPKKPGAVEGIVTNFASGAPIKKATVTLRSSNANFGYQAVSGPDGHFRLDNVEPGSYNISAEAEGFRVIFGLPRNSGPASGGVLVAEEQIVKDVALRLVPFGAISGKVLDENGDPIAGASVFGMQYSYSRLGKEVNVVQTTTTDERGEYRIFGLAPGRYLLGAANRLTPPVAAGRVHSNVREEGYAPTFYPGGARAAEAAPVDVAPGAELGDLDFRLRKTPAYHIRGKVIDARTRQPAKDVVIQSGACETGGPPGFAAPSGPTAVHADGAFDLRGIMPGCYIAQIERRDSSEVVRARERVTISDRDQDGVVLKLESAPAVSGAAFVDGASPDKLQGVSIRLEEIAGTFGNAAAGVRNDGTFLIPDVAPAAYRILVERLAPSLYLKSLRYGDRDVSDGRADIGPGGGLLTVVFGADPGVVEGAVEDPAQVKPDGSFAFPGIQPDAYIFRATIPHGGYLRSVQLGEKILPAPRIDLSGGSGALAIAIGGDGARLEGTALDSEGAPAEGALVVLVPTGRLREWTDLTRSAVAARDGKFEIRDIAPGDYQLLAWEDAEPGAPLDPDFRKPFLPQATPFHAVANGHDTVQLKALSVAAVR